MALLSTAQAAKIIGVSERRVRAMIAAGRLKAEPVGRAYVIRESDIPKLKIGVAGRPKKS